MAQVVYTYMGFLWEESPWPRVKMLHHVGKLCGFRFAHQHQWQAEQSWTRRPVTKAKQVLNVENEMYNKTLSLENSKIRRTLTWWHFLEVREREWAFKWWLILTSSMLQDPQHLLPDPGVCVFDKQETDLPVIRCCPSVLWSCRCESPPRGPTQIWSALRLICLIKAILMFYSCLFKLFFSTYNLAKKL